MTIALFSEVRCIRKILQLMMSFVKLTIRILISMWSTTIHFNALLDKLPKIQLLAGEITVIRDFLHLNIRLSDSCSLDTELTNCLTPAKAFVVVFVKSTHTLTFQAVCCTAVFSCQTAHQIHCIFPVNTANLKFL